MEEKINSELVYKKDIKSAIKKLKEQIKLECKLYDFIEVRNKKLNYDEIIKIIDQAFNDVI